MTAKQSAFKEAAMLAKEAETAEQNAQIFVLLQTQHDEQMKKILENMTKMQVQYKDLVKQKNKENHNPNVPIVPIVPKTGNDKIKYKPAVLQSIKPAEQKKERSKCTNCQRWGWHCDEDCLELETNKDKRPANYRRAGADKRQGPGTDTIVNKLVAENLSYTALVNNNYWSPLAKQVKDLESPDYIMNVEQQKEMDPRWIKILEKSRQAFIDSGAISGAAEEEDKGALINTGQPLNKTFMFPNNMTQKATKKMMLKHDLWEGALETNIIPGLHKPLLSVSKFADAGYTTIFDKNQANVYNASTTTMPPVLTAPRCTQSGLWTTPLEPNENKADVVEEELNAIFDLPCSKETARWHHAAAGFPEKETFLKAIRSGNYSTWSGLTAELMSKHYPESVETKKGHMKGPRQGIKSTKTNINAIVAFDGTLIKQEQNITSDLPEYEPPVKHNDVYFHVWDLSETIYSDDTGAFPYISQFGKKIIMIAVHMDANYIFAETMKNKTDSQRIHAYQKIIDQMKQAKLGLRKHVLDNEISKAYKARIALNGMTHKLVPPGNHRQNIAERGIQTFKSHMISIANGVSDDCPIRLWCQFVPQAELTLNLLRQSNITPKISAFAHVHGHHNYMRHPFAPIGCAVEIHVKPGDRGTWDIRTSVSGFSLGTSLEHYRCYNVYVTSTRATRISDQVYFRHKYITMPTMSPESYIVAAAQQLTMALKGNIPTDNDTATGLTNLGNLFNQIAATKAAASAKQLQLTNNCQTLKLHPAPTEMVPVPRVEVTIPRVVAEIPIITATVPRVPTTTTMAQHEMPASQPSMIPNFITQDDEDTQQDVRQHSYDTRANRLLQHVVAANILSVEIAMMSTEMEVPQSNIKSQPGTSWLGEMGNSVLGEDGKILEYKHLIANPKTKGVWQQAFGKELGRLAQGMPGRVEGTNTIFFTRKSDIPADRRGDVTYVGYVVNYREEKEDKYRFRLVVGGDRITYDGDSGTPTAELLTIKLLANSIVSTPNAKILTLDLKDFYLNTPMARPEFIQIKYEICRYTSRCHRTLQIKSNC